MLAIFHVCRRIFQQLVVWTFLRPRVRRLRTAVRTRPPKRWLHLLVFAALSCSAPGDRPTEDAPLGTVAQPLVDTDSDGLDDDWETTHFGNLSQTDSGDPDSDGMTNLEEYTHGFNPTVADAFDDADGDRFPNIFEIRNSSDPNDDGSTPTPGYVVNGAG